MAEDGKPSNDVSASTDISANTEGGPSEPARRIEELEAANEALRERVASLEATVTNAPNSDDENATEDDPETTDRVTSESRDENADSRSASGITISRRGALATLASLGLVGAASESAGAHHSGHNHLGETWSGDPVDPGLKLDVGSGTNVALFGQTASASARALKGVATAGSGTTIGIEGKAESPDSIALLGNATPTSGNAKGIEGRSDAKFGTGVLGFAKHTSGEAKGVRGLAQSPNGQGVRAINTATSGDAFGLTAETQSPSGTAILGDATSSSGTTYGVHGTASSPNGWGLYTPDDAKIEGTTKLATANVENIITTTLDADRYFSKSAESIIRIWQDGSEYVADGETGAIARDSDAAVVFQSAVDTLGDGGGRIYVRTGKYEFQSKVTDISSGTHIEGPGQNDPLLRANHADFIFETASGAEYVFFENLKFDGNAKTGSGIHILNPGTGAGGSSPAHVTVSNVHIVDADIGVHFEAAEDCTLSGRRISNCNIGVKWQSNAGWGLIDSGTHILGCNTNLQLDVEHMETKGAIFGEPTSQHIQLIDKVERLDLDGCWFEKTKPVVKTTDPSGTTHPIDDLIVSGGSTINIGNGNAAFNGDLGRVYLMGGAKLGSTDGTSVTLNGSNPDMLVGTTPVFDGNSSWGNQGFRHAIFPTSGGGEAMEMRFLAQIKKTDLTTGPTPSEDGVYATHSGSGTPPAGLYRSDPTNNQWVKVEDNTTTIAY